ncbi:MAG: hypothetical protein GX811_07390, partial [Lentisphaerae bacterium]|nr:hypothetical protein [Lentisphaerota bacterium]
MKNNNNNFDRLTSGSLFSALAYLTGPMLISGVLQNLQSMIDLFWVGRLGEDSVAAISLSGTVLMLMFPVIMGLATGVLAIVSRSIGAGDYEKAAAATGQALLMGTLLGIIAGIIGFFYSAPLLQVLGGEADVVR